MKRRMWMILAVAAAGLTFAAPVARAIAADTGKPVIDPKAETVLKAFCDYVQGLPRFSCELSLTMKTESEGMRQEIETTYGFAMEKPNKLALRHRRGMPGNTVVSNGSKLYTCMGAVNRYEEKEAPKTLDDLFQAAPMAGNMLFLDNLLRNDVYAAVMEGVTQLTLGTRETVDGQECERLSFKQDDFDWDMWITTGAKPVVLRVRTDLSKSMAAMGAEAPGMKSARMTVENRFAKWSVGGDMPDDTFTFTPPEGARKVASLFEGMNEDDDAAADEPDPAGSLVGQKAPAFSLASLDGGKVGVPDPAASNAVVVLDFWATWCGPCRKALPIVARVTASFKDKGVRLIAVNQQEQPERIKDFLKKIDVTCTVALDENGDVGSLYKVRGIPQTVLIGRDGKVQSVHVGLEPDLEAALTRELESMTADKAAPAAK